MGVFYTTSKKVVRVNVKRANRHVDIIDIEPAINAITTNDEDLLAAIAAGVDGLSLEPPKAKAVKVEKVEESK